MRIPAITILSTLALLALTGPSPLDAQQMRVRIRHTSVRVPVTPAPVRATPVAWKEGKGPNCLPRMQLAGAQLSKPGAIDLILRDRRRVRAQLDKRCMGLDLYRGFYVRPTSDDRVCADRDSIHARSGGECGIQRFRLLTPR